MIECLTAIASAEAEHGSSGVCLLKTQYQSTITDDREVDLNLIQLHGIRRSNQSFH